MYNLTQYRLKVNGIYYLKCIDGKTRKGVLVHSTKRGFNFVDFFTNKMLLHKHIYPIEHDRENAKELTFLIPMNIILSRISHKEINTKLLDKFIQETMNRSRTDVLYEWIKNGTISSEQFNKLLHFI